MSKFKAASERWRWSLCRSTHTTWLQVTACWWIHSLFSYTIYDVNTWWQQCMKSQIIRKRNRQIWLWYNMTALLSSQVVCLRLQCLEMETKRTNLIHLELLVSLSELHLQHKCTLLSHTNTVNIFTLRLHFAYWTQLQSWRFRFSWYLKIKLCAVHDCLKVDVSIKKILLKILFFTWSFSYFTLSLLLQCKFQLEDIKDGFVDFISAGFCFDWLPGFLTSSGPTLSFLALMWKMAESIKSSSEVSKSCSTDIWVTLQTLQRISRSILCSSFWPFTARAQTLLNFNN